MVVAFDNPQFHRWFKTVPKLPRKRGNQSSKAKYYYLNIVSAFDIETTVLDNEQAIMYIWQWRFGNRYTVIGRTWEEFVSFRDMILSELPDTKTRLMVYVHNLSYEFQFISDPAIYDFTNDEVFAVKSRKVLKCMMGEQLEFRCSYLLTNMSLAEFTTKYCNQYQKLSGEEFDYSIKRFPWTELTEKELQYCINDVAGLEEAITHKMCLDGDTLYTIPMTSTGYVRREAKHQIRRFPRIVILEQMPDFETYMLIRKAFQGGYTHANRFYANSETPIPNVSSYDRSSSYPDVLCNCKFPVTGFDHVSRETEIDEIIDLMKRNKAVVMRVAVYGLRTIDRNCPFPYLAVAKCSGLTNYVNDNGRILSADALETCITDIDLKLILKIYEWDDIIIREYAVARYGNLPYVLTDLIRKYYHDKTTLKGVAGQENAYMRGKAMLNSIYGMMVQDLVKPPIDYKSINGYFKPNEETPITDIFTDQMKKAFIPYAWGVWCTAWARYRLFEGLFLVGDDYVYSDTDSVKFIGNHSRAFERYNLDRIGDSKKTQSYATDPKGNTHYMGVYEFEEIYDEFKTLGSKKYAYVLEGKLGCTIAGVNKRKAPGELKTLANFKPGFVFRDAGGTALKYNDEPNETQIHENHKIRITKNVAILPSEYTLGITNDYAEIILTANKKIVDFLDGKSYN